MLDQSPKSQAWLPDQQDDNRFIASFDVHPEVTDQQPTADRIKSMVRLVIGSSPHQPPMSLERRRDARVAYPFPIDIMPIDSRGFIRTEQQVSVIGRFLSHRGLDFYHVHPLPFSRYRCILSAYGQSIVVTLVVGWSRCNEHGWMESGGRFVELED